MNSYNRHLESCGNLPSGEYFKKCESIYGGSQNFTILYSFRSGSIITFPSLKYTTYGANLCGLMRDCYMKELYLPNFNKMVSGGTNGVTIYNMPNLEILYCPNMEYPGSYSDGNYACGLASDCPKLKYVCLGNLKGGSPTFSLGFFNCIRLIKLEFGEGTAISVSMPAWNPTAAFDSDSDSLVENTELFNNNFQQFLYNFRIYIIDRLFDYTGGTKHTITLHSNVYNKILGTDSTGYANSFHMPDEPSVDYVTSLNQKLIDIKWSMAHT